MPIYGHHIGLSASQIGIVLATFSAYQNVGWFDVSMHQAVRVRVVERIEAAAVEVAIDGHSASVIRLTLEDK